MISRQTHEQNSIEVVEALLWNINQIAHSSPAQLGQLLGTADPAMIVIVQEPLSFRP